MLNDFLLETMARTWMFTTLFSTYDKITIQVKNHETSLLYYIQYFSSRNLSDKTQANYIVLFKIVPLDS